MPARNIIYGSLWFPDRRSGLERPRGQKHHIEQAKYGAIRYTEPFLNNQHIAEPTLYYLKTLATKTTKGMGAEWRDMEGNVLLKQNASLR